MPAVPSSAQVPRPTGRRGSRALAAQSAKLTSSDYQDLYSGLIRLRILHHAARAPIFALSIVLDLEGQGYKVSSGAIYPILRELERSGYLARTEKRLGKTTRHAYRATSKGRKALAAAKTKVKELFG
jgi:DNA-binding PadR family transcriptional regulator